MTGRVIPSESSGMKRLACAVIAQAGKEYAQLHNDISGMRQDHILYEGIRIRMDDIEDELTEPNVWVSLCGHDGNRLLRQIQRKLGQTITR